LLVICLLLGPGAPVSSANAVEAQAVPTFYISGTGFGHGIGMSQYGAQGSALAGKDHRWILSHYYTGTTVSAAPAKTIRVNIDAAANYDSGGNSGFTKTSWRIEPGDSSQRLVIAGVPSVQGRYTFTGSGSSVTVTPPGGLAPVTLSGTVRITASGGTPPLLRVVEGTGIYSFTNARYRGTLELSSSSGRIKLVNVLPMDSYLYGVVPRESFSSWHAEALKAQAIAARSYAYTQTTAHELYCTTRSQAYQGYGAYNSSNVWVGEMASTNTAVAATKDLVIKYGTRIVRAYYSSHSGGHTANNEDVWVTGSPLPEMRGVPDTYEYLAKPPYAPWPADREKTYTGSQMADRLRGLSGVPASPAYVVGASVERATSGHARYVTFRFSNGASAKVSGDTVRTKLSLLSTNFRFSGFPITRIQGANRYATAQAISARAFPATAPAVVIASGEAFADALTGSALAGTVGGPLLLTSSWYLPDATAAELGRLRPSKVYLLGGTTAVNATVEAAIRSAVPAASVTRLAGADRYATAVAVADIVVATAGSSSAILASGESWPDAASASALAYARKIPILLTPADELHDLTRTYLAARRPTTVLAVGGTSVLSPSTFSSAANASGSTPTRLFGPDRYSTSAAIARYTMTTEPRFVADYVYIGTGVEYADALTGGTLAGAQRRPMLLMYRDACTAGTASFLDQYHPTITRLVLFGGTAAISEKGHLSVDEVMMR
jgi:SpoIID/LytB domain protein